MYVKCFLSHREKKRKNSIFTPYTACKLVASLAMASYRYGTSPESMPVRVEEKET